MELGNDCDQIDHLKRLLAKEFELKDLEQLKFFLEMEVARAKNGIYVSLRKYTIDLLQETGMLRCKAVARISEEDEFRDMEALLEQWHVKSMCDRRSGAWEGGRWHDFGDETIWRRRFQQYRYLVGKSSGPEALVAEIPIVRLYNRDLMENDAVSLLKVVNRRLVEERYQDKEVFISVCQAVQSSTP
ncbi:uncharacterized protein LOC127108244 [Lathyrus oleraceus]|uniref:uncharacterized protein LOC127108244 n=1 Tax=Pisum sativum TaxID=3888 RepID=UPI0021CE534D|nr:uncharacterized protein LOC127108244 [Pisum sativum]